MVEVFCSINAREICLNWEKAAHRHSTIENVELVHAIKIRALGKPRNRHPCAEQLISFVQSIILKVCPRTHSTELKNK